MVQLDSEYGVTVCLLSRSRESIPLFQCQDNVLKGYRLPSHLVFLDFPETNLNNSTAVLLDSIDPQIPDVPRSDWVTLSIALYPMLCMYYCPLSLLFYLLDISHVYLSLPPNNLLTHTPSIEILTTSKTRFPVLLLPL